ncbi:hypothetical protein RI129_005249 [Pyrocoelia pectoralis]|uniref:Timeless n=1 Tax=Pyrocoelia pectoralis TaxID=417401 RepID=A0AAN7VEF0_9COLE
MVESTVNPQIHNTFASLGSHHGDLYVVNKSCLSNLEEIFKNLVLEDRTLRTYRRAIGFGENIQKDLIPLLINVRNSTTIEDATKIIDATVKILLNLTAPIECLLSLEHEAQTDVGRHTIFELNRLLITSKEAFTDNRSTKAVVDHIKYIVEKDSNLNGEQCDSIHNCLLLLRNILHIPENRIYISNFSFTSTNMQNHIIWNLFSQSIDKMLIYLMTCPQKAYWGATMVQLISLMYKDQHVGTLQKLLSLPFEASLSESSEDNESNTSPKNEESGESSPLVTSDPTSDSSDNGSKCADRTKITSERYKNSSDNVCGRMVEAVRATQNANKSSSIIKKEKSQEADGGTNGGRKHSIDSGVCLEATITSCSTRPNLKNTKRYVTFQGELSDCGYVTQVENKDESISTSSNDDDQPQGKPVHHFEKARNGITTSRNVNALERKELRRKKLVKRSKTNIINVKGLMHHVPTDEDITNLLKGFTVDFLLKAFGVLVQDLYTHLLTNVDIPIDISHFFWLITYFLKFATQLELDLEFINPILSYNIISYLVFQAVLLFEEFEISCRTPINIKPSLRRLHLVVTAIREFIQSLETYEKVTQISDSDHERLLTLQVQMTEMEELRNLFLLLLRHYDSNYQSKQYLQDVIVTNHSYLLLLDKICKSTDVKINVEDHLKEFATVECMHLYGILLEEFENNGEHVNNCIFTMMHHMAGDLGNIATLFQPNILKTFSQIWETDFKICDDWSDLIEFVIRNSVSVFKNNGASLVRCPENVTSGLASQITEKTECPQNGEYEKCAESVTDPETIKNTSAFVFDVNSFNTDFIVFNDDVNILKDHFIKHNKQKYLLWLQKLVLKACFAKLIITDPNLKDCKTQSLQPVTHYNTLLNLPVSLVPWTSEQSNIIKYQPFLLLLHQFGFILPGDIGKVFIRIPNFWTSDYLFTIAKQLGPIDPEICKFDLNLVSSTGMENKRKTTQLSFAKNDHFSSIAMHFNSTTRLSINVPNIEIVPCDVPTPSLIVAQDLYSLNKETSVELFNFFTFPGIDEMEYNSICETTSVHSDLTRMCVSDEEDKLVIE